VKTVGLLAACDDPKLFGIELWPKQRELLTAVEQGARIHVWALGRRSGKTTMAAIVCLHSCLFRADLDAMVRPGERRYAVAVATNREQARLLVRAARSIVEDSPLLAELVESATEDELTFRNGTALRSFACSARGSRGWPVSAFVMDEAAHFLTETDGYQTADRVWEALVPSTAQFGDAARVIVSSTPYGREGLFARLYEQADRGELPDAVAHHGSTAEVNPTITTEFLAAEEARDPDAFAQEYEANFTASGDAYLDFSRFEIANRGPLPPAALRGCVVGLDPAFARDPFGVAVVGRDAVRAGHLLVARIEARRPTGSFVEPVDAVAALAREYGARIVTDQYAAAAVVERLRDAGLPVRTHTMTATTKTAIFGELRARLYDGSLDLLDDPETIAELRRLRTRFTAGQAAVLNPRVGGSHGDRAQALALAVYELAQLGRPGQGRVRTGGYSGISPTGDPMPTSLSIKDR